MTGRVFREAQFDRVGKPLRGLVAFEVNIPASASEPLVERIKGPLSGQLVRELLTDLSFGDHA